MPFHFWLSDARAVALTPVCVIFSGAMVSVGLFALAKPYSEELWRDLRVRRLGARPPHRGRLGWLLLRCHLACDFGRHLVVLLNNFPGLRRELLQTRVLQGLRSFAEILCVNMLQ